MMPLAVLTVGERGELRKSRIVAVAAADYAQAKKLSGNVKGAYKKVWMLDSR